MPFNILGLWLRGLLAVALVGLGVFLLSRGYDNRQTVEIERVEVAAGEEVVAGEGRAEGPGGGRWVDVERVVSWEAADSPEVELDWVKRTKEEILGGVEQVSSKSFDREGTFDHRLRSELR